MSPLGREELARKLRGAEEALERENLERLESKTQISVKDLKAMQLLEAQLDEESLIEKADRIKVQKMLKSMIGNMDMNVKLNSLYSFRKKESAIGAELITALRNLSYETRHLSTIGPEMERIWNNFNSPHEKAEHEKLSLEELGALVGLAKLYETLKKYENKQLFKGSATLTKLYENLTRAHTIISHLDATLEQQFKFPVGSIVLDHGERKARVVGRSLNSFDRFMGSVFLKYDHAAAGIVKEKVNLRSHLYPRYGKDKFGLLEFAYSDVYHLNLKKLIKRDTQKLLKEHLGEDWLAELEKKYSIIERKMHDSEIMGRYSAEVDLKTCLSALARGVIPGGNKAFYFWDHTRANVRDEILGRNHWEDSMPTNARILCSDFVGKTLIAAVKELDDKIREQLHEMGVENIPCPVIRSPISKKENLQALTPNRLLEALEERRAVDRVEMATDLDKFLARGPVANYWANRQPLREEKSEEAVSLQSPRKLS